MKKLIILVGPPGSGKSTMAELYLSEYTYINQDRQGRKHLSLFEKAIADGENVLIDRMNFNKSQRSRYLDPAKAAGYETKIIVLHQPYAVCFKRCVERKDHPTIKDEVAARSALNTFFTKYERVTDDEANEVIRVWPSGEKPKAIISDLDGTLCNVEHRRHFVRRPPGERKDWQSFFKGMTEDSVNEWCALILSEMSKSFQIVYCSGRPDNWKKDTIEWLKKKDLFYLCVGGKSLETHLYMRPRNDSRQDNIAKEIILDFELLTRFSPYLFIDDRQQVVDMYRSRGFTVLQCDRGDF